MQDLNPQARVDLAAAIGVHPGYVYQVLTKRKLPSAELSLAIERATYHVITRKELRPDDYWLIWPDLPRPPAQQPPKP